MESDVNNLEGWYKDKKANYHNPQTSTSQVTGINLAKRFAQNKTNQSNNQSNN